MWITPETYGDPFIYISTSYGESCNSVNAVLTEFGAITIGTIYHLIISINDTFTSIDITSNHTDSLHHGQYLYHHVAPTKQSHIGRAADVWFMSGKFGNNQYNRGNGTFSDSMITSSISSVDLSTFNSLWIYHVL